MSEWLAQPLGSLAAFQKGRKVETSGHPREGFAPYLGASAISGVVEEYGDMRAGVIAAPGEVLMLWDGERSGLVGKAQAGVISSTVARLSPKTDVECEYLYYALDFKFEWIQGRRTGTGVPHVPKDLARILSISYPKSKSEQRRIAEILSTLDDAIAQTEALIAKHQQIKAGLMHDLFTRGVTSDGHLRPTREQAPDLYKESPLGWIPKEWEISQLGEVAEVNRGKFTIRPRNDLRFYGGQYPFIQTGDVSLANGRVLSTFSQTLNQSGLAVSRLFDEGTIMVTIAANIADTCVLGLPMCAPDSLVGVLPNKGQVSRFLQLCISRRKSWLEARAPQTAQKNINLEDLRPLLIPTPCQHEQEAIAAIYECVDFSLAESEQMVGKLRQQKYGLMHDLLTGRMRVNV
ncbi:restriction endonuclease subunit S [Acidithiobacillus ferrooxidans]|jgi:type I restriction enzyme S subunit|uniref:restriction endonuclease subunit S n=1 Tax=Acidithiobacillus ferrooxidans TaxID=920 RepID=UPI001C06C663|nr:restriction endonuclease subunit S [Acidithiobacillus ferrooxidans]MBU2858598.1 restriction endonuclease subunit S [Acidithiobacillus ferrooxidans]